MKNYKIILSVSLIVSLIAHPVVSQEVIKLGETPWKFKKLENTFENIAPASTAVNNEEDLSGVLDGDRNTVWTTQESSHTFLIDMGEMKSVEDVKIIFNSLGATKVAYKAEGFMDLKFSSRTFVDYLNEPQACFQAKATVIGSIENTVGYTENVTSSSVSFPVKTLIRYLRIQLDHIYDQSGENLPLEIKDIEIYAGAGGKAGETEEYKDLAFNDGNWETVGIPHCYNDKDTYMNVSEASIWKGETWYRKKFTTGKKKANKRYYLEFKSVNVGCAVYINGRFKKGNTQVPQPEEVTNVGGFIPFVLDITEDIVPDGENILAVRVSNAPGAFFTWPGFGVYENFGMAWGGIVSEVNLHIKDEINIPLNAFAVSGTWGTYNAVKSADENRAELYFQTHLLNTTGKEKKVKLSTRVLNTEGKEITGKVSEIILPAQGESAIEQEMSVENPILWYPNCSEYGDPYLYTVERIVYDGKKIADRKTERLGIRMVTWDEDYCYINGKKHILRGFGHRNIYPALGSAIPEELQWQDIAYIAQCRGNTFRMGHIPPLPGFMEACDVYGIMVMLNSGDNEWALKNEPAITYKREADRNAILAFRNYPSVILWESNNGLAKDGELYLPSYTQEIVEKYDYINPRIVMNRDWYPPEWDASKNVVVGYTNWYTKINGSPSINTEVYGANWEGRASWNIARFDYANEKRFTSWFVNNYLSDLDNKACGWIDWMLAETQGEGYTIYLNGKRNQKSLGSCAMDANRIPKLKYRVYEKALWVPYERKPGVTLQTNWNLDGVQNIDAWSNCPFVEVVVNGRSYGTRSNDSRDKRMTWENIVWEEGEVVARGLDENKEICCTDTIRSSGKPYRIALQVEPELIRPDGAGFERTANGSDVLIFTARIEDENGNWCTLSDMPITFEVAGEGVYCGSADFYVTDGKPETYHVPGDPELSAEGGLRRIAVKSTFTPGKVSVIAKAPGLKEGRSESQFKPVRK